MALTVQKETKMAGTYIATERLYRTEDGRLVAEGDPDARFLFCVPGKKIPLAEARRYGLVPDDEAEALPADSETETGFDVDGLTVEEVLDRVAGDPERAEAVLAVERARDKPRSTLIAALEDLIEPGSEE